LLWANAAAANTTKHTVNANFFMYLFPALPTWVIGHPVAKLKVKTMYLPQKKLG
jgi:hypothetical protein